MLCNPSWYYCYMLESLTFHHAILLSSLFIEVHNISITLFHLFSKYCSYCTLIRCPPPKALPHQEQKDWKKDRRSKALDKASFKSQIEILETRMAHHNVHNVWNMFSERAFQKLKVLQNRNMSITYGCRSYSEYRALLTVGGWESGCDVEDSELEARCCQGEACKNNIITQKEILTLGD